MPSAGPGPWLRLTALAGAAATLLAVISGAAPFPALGFAASRTISNSLSRREPPGRVLVPAHWTGRAQPAPVRRDAVIGSRVAAGSKTRPASPLSERLQSSENGQHVKRLRQAETLPVWVRNESAS